MVCVILARYLCQRLPICVMQKWVKNDSIRLRIVFSRVVPTVPLQNDQLIEVLYKIIDDDRKFNVNELSFILFDQSNVWDHHISSVEFIF
jgi:hypothetical protein